MPSGVFKPYTGVSTAILIFTKTNSGGTGNVWFYDMKADGYTLDDKRNEIENDNIQDIIDRWKTLGENEIESQRARTQQSFTVPVSEIADNDWGLSINRYKEIVYEAVDYDTPDEIINGKTDEDGNTVKGIKQLIRDNQNDLEDLEKMLKF